MAKKENKDEKKEVDKVAEAQKILMEEEMKKQEACSKEIQVVLQKYGYSLQTTPSRITLVPVQKE